jgi:hypothetical protein
MMLEGRKEGKEKKERGREMQLFYGCRTAGASGWQERVNHSAAERQSERAL